MEPHDITPCGPSGMWLHVVITMMNCMTLVLTSWLTARARRIDRNGRVRKAKPSEHSKP